MTVPWIFRFAPPIEVQSDRTHYHLGYNLFIVGESSGCKKQFLDAISEKLQVKGLIWIGDVLAGTAWTKQYEEREFAD